jgi:inhibitor of cysteine peptidase
MKGTAVYTGLRSRIRRGLNGIRLGWPHCRAAVRLPDCVLSLAVGLVALLLALAACGTVSGNATYTRDTRTITVESGERFTIKLNASPGIGDDWRIVGGLERGRVKLVDESYQADDRGVPGGSGTTSFLFEATQPGTTELTLFNCYRCAGADKPSPENAQLAETLVFTITVS